MSLKEEIRISKQRVSNLSSAILDETKKLARLKKSKEVSNNDLYNGIEKFIDVKVKTENYQYILGGDGRSQPWDETRNGKVASISIKDGFYISEDQKEIVEDYVRKVYKPDHIKPF